MATADQACTNHHKMQANLGERLHALSLAREVMDKLSLGI